MADGCDLGAAGVAPVWYLGAVRTASYVAQETEMTSWLPVRYQIQDRPAYVIALVNWLEHEAMGYEYLEKYPVLQEMAGWRSRECYDAIKAYDWTTCMFEGMNGPGAVV